MTIAVSEELLSGPYDGNDVTTVFDYNFTIYAETELIVTLLSADGLTETVQTLTTNYTVSPSGGVFPAMGTITMLVPPATGEKLVIEPSITQSQERPFSSQGSVSLDELEAAYDKLTSIARGLQQLIDRVVITSAFEEAGSIKLPVSSAGQVIGWSVSGTLTNLTLNDGAFLDFPSDIDDGELLVNDGGDPATFKRSNIYVDADNVRVGIGVSTPLYSLHVQGATPRIGLRDTDEPAGEVTLVEQAGAKALVSVDPTDASVSASEFEVAIDGTATFAVKGSAIKLPVGTTAQRPSAPVEGDFRRNSTTGELEVYDGSSWDPVITSGNLEASVAGVLNAAGSAPMFAVRAWVNFNGTGTVAIRGSGNVSSITDSGAGLYDVNFTTAMNSTNYAVAPGSNSAQVRIGASQTVSSVGLVNEGDTGANEDSQVVTIIVVE